MRVEHAPPPFPPPPAAFKILVNEGDVGRGSGHICYPHGGGQHHYMASPYVACIGDGLLKGIRHSEREREGFTAP